jgi:hypothetical protein
VGKSTISKIEGKKASKAISQSFHSITHGWYHSSPLIHSDINSFFHVTSFTHLTTTQLFIKLVGQQLLAIHAQREIWQDIYTWQIKSWLENNSFSGNYSTCWGQGTQCSPKAHVLQAWSSMQWS